MLPSQCCSLYLRIFRFIDIFNPVKDPLTLKSQKDVGQFEFPYDEMCEVLDMYIHICLHHIV